MFIIKLLNVVRARSGGFELGVKVIKNDPYFPDHDTCRKMENIISQNVMNMIKNEKLCDQPINNMTANRLSQIINDVINSLRASGQYGQINVQSQQMMMP